MPLIKQEPDIFPRTLFDMPEAEYPWWVAHVRSRQEKVLARHLLRLSVGFYLPQREHRSRRAGRTFVSFPPLFPGYVFFRGSADDRVAAWQSGVIVRILDVEGQAALRTELRQIHQLQRSGASLVSSGPVDGDPVRIVAGPFRGFTGVVVRSGGRPRLIVSISMLHQSLAVEFDRQVVSLVQSVGTVDNPRSAVA